MIKSNTIGRHVYKNDEAKKKAIISFNHIME